MYELFEKLKLIAGCYIVSSVVAPSHPEIAHPDLLLTIGLMSICFWAERTFASKVQVAVKLNG